MTVINRRGTTPPVAIEVAPAYEFLMSLAIINDPMYREDAEAGPAWFAAIEKRAGASLLRRLRDLTSGRNGPCINLIPLAYDAPQPRDVPALLSHLEGTDAEEILLAVVGYYDYHHRRTTPPEVMRAAVRGEEPAISEFLRTSDEWPEWRAFLEQAFELGAATFKRDLMALLHEWSERVWEEEQASLMPILERDAEAKRLLAGELPFERFVEVATNGVEFVSRPGIDRLVLVPSFVNRPWVTTTEHRGAMILIYPVADESVSADRDAPPLRLVRLSKALADEKRLRILRALAERPRSLMELAEHLGLPKTTMHHHMVTLRSAGLVSVRSGTKQYRLRHDTLPDVGQLLSGYIGAAPDPSAAPIPAGGGRRR